MLTNKVIVKAPGKVLIAGGYGVLEQGNLGLTLAVDKYFYSVSSSLLSQHDEPIITIGVKSPQISAKWNYLFNSNNNTIQQSNNISNPFLQSAIKYTLIYAYRILRPKITKISILLLQDRGFLSENQTENTSKFIYYDKNSAKTGLGSSATVIVVTVQAVLRQLTSKANKELINVISQVANLAAQNKIGSNFDISTAVYVSHLYTNILPAKAYAVTTSHDFQALLNIDPQVKGLKPVCKQLINGFCCMIDLKKGSNTRKMVSGFIKTLNQQHPNTISEFYRLSKLHVSQIYEIIAKEEDFHLVKERMKILNAQYRKFIQLYSSITKIPVEPPQLQTFLNHLCEIHNIIYTICPGSGGYDAIFVLTAAQTIEQREKLNAQIIFCLQKHTLMGSIGEIKIVWRQQSLDSSQLNAIDAFLS